MTRLGPWHPTSIEERIDRIESESMIRQLASRYARSLDARDHEQLAALFHPEVQVGRDRSGRAALRDFYDSIMEFCGVSVHFVGNHVIDFQDADHATGVVYCIDELERGDLGEWQKGRIQYWDTYERVEGEWCFVRRKLCRWYITDALNRPAVHAGLADEPMQAVRLPHAYATWEAYAAAHLDG